MFFDQKQCGARIRTVRKKHNLSLSQFATIFNVSVQHVSRIEHGSKGISIDLLVEIALYFDVPLDYLILGKTYAPQGIKTQIEQIIEDLSKLKAKL